MVNFVKVEASTVNWRVIAEDELPKGVFNERRTRWIDVDNLHEVTTLPDEKMENGEVEKRCLAFAGSQTSINSATVVALLYIIHGLSAVEFVGLLNPAPDPDGTLQELAEVYDVDADK